MTFRTLRAGLTALLARSCVMCSLAPGDPLCPDCEDDFFPASRPRCGVCALPLAQAAPACGRCLAVPPSQARTTALADYGPPVDGLIHALKSGARLDLAAAFGMLLARRTGEVRGALVVPVPLSHERLAERGFNQAAQIARTYCRLTGVSLATDAVRRIRHAPPQQSLALEARRRNLHGAFHAPRALDGRPVLLLDDVMTTGSTIGAVARTLATAGAGPIHALVVARTP